MYFFTLLCILLTTALKCAWDYHGHMGLGKSCILMPGLTKLLIHLSNASSQHLISVMHCTNTSPQDCQSEDGTSLEKQIQEWAQFNYRTEGVLRLLGDKTPVPRINMLCIAVQWSDKYAEASEENSQRLCQESNSKTKMKSKNPNTFFIKKIQTQNQNQP